MNRQTFSGTPSEKGLWESQSLSKMGLAGRGGVLYRIECKPCSVFDAHTSFSVEFNDINILSFMKIIDASDESIHFFLKLKPYACYSKEII